MNFTDAINSKEFKEYFGDKHEKWTATFEHILDKSSQGLSETDSGKAEKKIMQTIKFGWLGLLLNIYWASYHNIKGWQFIVIIYTLILAIPPLFFHTDLSLLAIIGISVTYAMYGKSYLLATKSAELTKLGTVKKQSWLNVLITFIILLIGTTVGMYPELQAEIAGNNQATSTSSNKSSSFEESYDSSYREQWYQEFIPSCVGVNTDNEGVQKICTCVADRSIEELSTTELNSELALKNIMSKCMDDSVTQNDSSLQDEVEKNYLETNAIFLGYAELDWGCFSDFIINGEKVEVEGCPEDKSIYRKNEGKALKLKYTTGMVEGFKTYYFVGVSNSAELYDKTREKSRVYATLEMGTSEEYNKEAIRKIKENNNKFAGFALGYDTDESGIIDKITLNSPTDNLLSIVISHGVGQKPDNAWSLEKIEEIVNKLKNQYRKIDENEEVIEYDLGTVQNQILKYHEMRDSPSQADYDADVRNAHAIQNLKSVFIFDNKGDNIVVTVKTCLEGNGNTTPELLLTGEIYQNSLTIEYKSKNLVELENKNRDAQLRKERAKEKKEASEMESL